MLPAPKRGYEKAPRKGLFNCIFRSMQIGSGGMSLALSASGQGNLGTSQGKPLYPRGRIVSKIGIRVKQ